MNLIVNRQLDRAQKQVIYELTMKKRQSKKSTMSAKQVAARQQLARELMHERLESPLHQRLQEVAADRQEELINSHRQYNQPASNQVRPIILSRLTRQSHNQSGSVSFSIHDTSQLDSLTTDDQSIDELPSTATLSSATGIASNDVTMAGSTSSSFSRSDSSYSAGSSTGASQEDQMMMLMEQHLQLQQQQQQPVDEAAINARKKEANIKFLKTRLEHLNSELERRLYQYEYLVAQEKALLGTKNMMLFIQQGVNNFHLYEAQSTPARRVRSFQRQQQQQQQQSQTKPKIQDNSPTDCDKNFRFNSPSSSSQAGAALVNKSQHKQQLPRAHLNSSVSTVANLNTLHMLPSLAGPRRSASSVALMSISQGQEIE